jgi:hypothetical protein
MKRKGTVKDFHHRLPRCKGGTNDPENIREVDKSKHQSFHHLFYEGSPQKVANIANKWIDPNYMLIVVRRDDQKEFDGQGIS